VTVVYDAELCSLLGERVVLKVITPASRHVRSRVIRAAGLVSGIRGEHIAPVLGVAELDGSLLTVTRRVGGNDLGETIAREGPLAPVAALAILSDIASALDAAHDRGLLHLNLKPSNVIVAGGPGLAAFVTDFGHSSLPAPQDDYSWGDDRAHDPVDDVPVHFLAPETILGERGGPWTDLYVLGCLAYLVFAGRPPFAAAQAMRVLFSHVADPVPAVRELAPDVPMAVDDAIQRAMAKAPLSRFLRAREFIDAIRAGLGSPSDPGGSPAEIPAPGSPQRIELAYSPWRWIDRDEARWLGSTQLEHQVAHLHEVPPRGSCGRYLLSVESAEVTDVVVSSPPELLVPTLPNTPAIRDTHAEAVDLYGLLGQQTHETGHDCRDPRTFERVALDLVRAELEHERERRTREALEVEAANDVPPPPPPGPGSSAQPRTGKS
jgi:serine/threonine protein kinase